ncbi:hypothetical protein HYPSUDRAFT_32799 [Hypholoma sublateritium FD-334 SS-4]|uniref:DUF7704 domain-containing protein n=1 Tax=Hypholoma sublateritium (strain FD-334 SS-4) TaxID=945553 RepID=A0A0D2PF46_HYPSF|nr:hypothetical protein HYPSUDRAFT_32799 [Hypholoma sublateritium FD-334 SS-4]
MSSDSFPALPGIYRLLFLYLEPISTITPALMVWFFPGASWFYHQLIPSASPVPVASLEPKALMAIWQLTNCYFLLGLISSLVFRAVRDALPNNPAAQERILGASFLALGIADLTHIFATFLGLPPDLKYAPGLWNSMTHGNITFVIVLFSFRFAWYAGIGRKRYYFGVTPSFKAGKNT